MTNQEITQNIDKAIASHGMWKMRLRNAIKTHASEFDIATVKTSNNCDFGKWLIKDKGFLGRFEDFNTVDTLHKNLHIETARIMQLALSGKSEEAASAIAVGSKFASLSSKLTIAMMGWKRGLAA